MDDVHEVREIQGAIDALGPAAVPAEEFSRAAVPQQAFHRFFEIHAVKIPEAEEKTNGVKSEYFCSAVDANPFLRPADGADFCRWNLELRQRRRDTGKGIVAWNARLPKDSQGNEKVGCAANTHVI